MPILRAVKLFKLFESPRNWPKLIPGQEALRRLFALRRFADSIRGMLKLILVLMLAGASLAATWFTLTCLTRLTHLPSTKGRSTQERIQGAEPELGLFLSNRKTKEMICFLAYTCPQIF